MFVYFIFTFFVEEINFNDIILFVFINILVMNSLASFFMKNPIYSLLFLICNYLIAGFIFMLNNLIFMGLVFILVYVGAVSILLLFTFMLLNLKTIYYTSLKIQYYFNILTIIFIIEFLLFFFLSKSFEFINNDTNNFISWFSILNNKDDLLSIAYELYQKNSILVFFSSIFLLMSLVASVNIVNSLKDSKKQDAFLQLKKYVKNIVS